MKKEYKTPMLEIAKYESESPMMAGTNNNDWGMSKEGFFDEDEDIDDIENKKNLWDD